MIVSSILDRYLSKELHTCEYVASISTPYVFDTSKISYMSLGRYWVKQKRKARVLDMVVFALAELLNCDKQK